MLASPTSRWSVGAVLLTVLVLVSSWFVLIGPRRADASAVREQAVSQQNQAQVLEQQIGRLRSEFSDLPERTAELTAIKEQLPASADVPALVRSLQDYAAASGVSLDSLAPGVPSIVTSGGAPAPTTAGPGMVVSIPIAVTVSGDYFEDALFIRALQSKLDRAFLITAITTAQTAEVSTGADTPAPMASPTATSATPATVTGAPVVTSMQITGAVFVLLDDSTTLEDVAQEAAATAVPARTPA